MASKQGQIDDYTPLTLSFENRISYHFFQKDKTLEYTHSLIESSFLMTLKQPLASLLLILPCVFKPASCAATTEEIATSKPTDLASAMEIADARRAPECMPFTSSTIGFWQLDGFSQPIGLDTMEISSTTSRAPLTIPPPSSSSRSPVVSMKKKGP